MARKCPDVGGRGTGSTWSCSGSAALAVPAGSFPGGFPSVHSSSHPTFLSNGDHTAARITKKQKQQQQTPNLLLSQFFRRKKKNKQKQPPNFASKGFYWLLHSGVWVLIFQKLPAPVSGVPLAGTAGPALRGRRCGAGRRFLRTRCGRRRRGPGAEVGAGAARAGPGRGSVCPAVWPGDPAAPSALPFCCPVAPELSVCEEMVLMQLIVPKWKRTRLLCPRVCLYLIS